MIYEAYNLTSKYLLTKGTDLYRAKLTGEILMTKLVEAGIATERSRSVKTGKITSIICHSLPSEAEMEVLCGVKKHKPKVSPIVVAGLIVLGLGLMMYPIMGGF